MSSSTIVVIAIIVVIIFLLLSGKDQKIINQKMDKAVEGLVDETDEIGLEDVELTPRQLKEQKLNSELDRAGFPITAKEFVRIKIFSTLFLFLSLYFLTGNIMIVAIVVCAWQFVPNIALKMAKEKKKEALEQQIPAALSLIKNSLEAGMSFNQALEIVADEMDPPISEEFQRVLKDTKLGRDMKVALLAMLDRVQSDELKLVVVAVNIQREVGGNLVDILDVILETIKDRIQIKGEIKTLTAQGRMSAIIISALPIALGLIMYVMNPEYMSPLFTEPLGQVLLAGCLIFMFIGVFFISKIVKIDF